MIKFLIIFSIDLYICLIVCTPQGLDQESEAAMSLISNTTAKLTSAVSSLPQLLEQKRLLDMHTTIATGKDVSVNLQLKFKICIFCSYS
jgi:hypothetical protein